MHTRYTVNRLSLILNKFGIVARMESAPIGRRSAVPSGVVSASQAPGLPLPDPLAVLPFNAGTSRTGHDLPTNATVCGSPSKPVDVKSCSVLSCVPAAVRPRAPRTACSLLGLEALAWRFGGELPVLLSQFYRSPAPLSRTWGHRELSISATRSVPVFVTCTLMLGRASAPHPGICYPEVGPTVPV